MDDLSNMMIHSGVDCYIDNVCVNPVFYVVLCVMAPCVTALQELLKVLESDISFYFNAKNLFFMTK